MSQGFVRFEDYDISEAGIVRRGWDKIKSKVLKMFKGPAVKSLVEKYAKKFLDEAGDLIKEYEKISESVSKDFNEPYQKLKARDEQIEKNLTNPENTNEQTKKYEEQKKQLNNEMKILQENIDEYFKLNNLNSEIEKKLDDYTQIISDKIEQSNWLLNVELSKKDKSELMQLWKRKVPHLKLQLKQKFVELTKKSAIADIYKIREDLRFMQEQSKNVNVYSPTSEKILYNLVIKALVNFINQEEEYKAYADYTKAIAKSISENITSVYAEYQLQNFITRKVIPQDVISAILKKAKPKIDEAIKNGKLKKNDEYGASQEKTQKGPSEEDKIKQKIANAVEKWLSRAKERRPKAAFDYADYVGSITNTIYHDVINLENAYGLAVFKGNITENEIEKLFLEYQEDIDDGIKDIKQKQQAKKPVQKAQPAQVPQPANESFTSYLNYIKYDEA